MGRKNGSILDPRTKIPNTTKTNVLTDGEPEPLVFTRQDWTEFRDPARISAKAGVSRGLLPRVVVKELVDNALDATGGVEFGLLGGEHEGAGSKENCAPSLTLFVSNRGPGLPGTDEELATHFSIRRPLTSSKTRRMPTRGMLGNGLRVVAGVALVSGGELKVCTRGRALRLVPRPEGHTEVVEVAPWNEEGTRIEVIFRGEFASIAAKDGGLFEWAHVACLLTHGDQYRGKSSPWWYGDSSFWELLQAAGHRPLERVLETLDGCTERKRVAKVAGGLRGRGATSIKPNEAATLLAAAQHSVRPVPPSRLGKVGPIESLGDGYAVARGEFEQDGAQIPFVVEVWAKRSKGAKATVCVNRTPVVNNPGCWRHDGDVEYVLNGGGFDCDSFRVGQKRGGDFSITVNVISPFVPLTSSGKDPDLSPMMDQILTAAEKAVRTAKRNKPKGRGKSSQKDLILSHRSEAAEVLSGGGVYGFSLRQFYYRIRPRLIDAFGKDPSYNTFSRVVGQYEDKCGDIEHLYRDDRGTIYHPHTHDSLSLGTRSVADYERPSWGFNKILYCEKEGLFPLLQQARWPERHDCALLTSKGYATRAAREVIRMINRTGEPIQFFCIHDADGDGTMIFETLCRAFAGHNVKVINLGLDPAEGREMGLELETIHRKRTVRVGRYISDSDREWLQTNRIELNAMPTPQFLAWLTRKMSEHDSGKVVPPIEVVQNEMTERAREAIRKRLTEDAIRSANVNARVEKAIAELKCELDIAAKSLASSLPSMLADHPLEHWSGVVDSRANEVAAPLS
ncbi:hypothetical protein J8F10_29690 [Gemmata sp. G18]|uniref:Topoisomerase 6 subunit A/Spo11 TOPRIM domain-containing protein n=1 Tax=Gemmata palustris TaxID=2822762 RepID=A0ABS5C0C6_9BACT|nr:hypothetical protein [Gemmata palustris]MBP3959437.1 hypothetical protein [Gemmata palustris]